jgi:hypothetical protein
MRPSPSTSTLDHMTDPPRLPDSAFAGFRVPTSWATMLTAGLIAAACICLTLSEAARASSIVYTKDHNVWLTSPDGARQHKVTADGTSGAPYYSPSQADDGTILAARTGRLLRMRQNGEQLNPPVEVGVTPLAPDVSPDGTKVAYHVTGIELCGWLGQYCGTRSRSLFSWSSRPAPPFELDDGGGDLIQPSWMDNTRVVATSNAYVWTDEVGGADESPWWFDPGLAELSDADVSRRGDKVAVVRGSAAETVQIYNATGAPPSVPQPACFLTDPAGGRFNDPTWSPDGGTLAVADGAGIWLVGPCGSADPSAPLVPGGSEPDWGPADVNPPPRDPPPRDRDGDGVADPLDRCPDTPASTPDGCPATRRDTSPPRISLKLVRRQTRASVLRRGLALHIGTNEAARGSLTLTFGHRPLARRLRVPQSFRRSLSLPRSGTFKVSFRLTRNVTRKLGRVRTLRLKLGLRLSDAAGNQSRLGRNIFLTRTAVRVGK